jgi:hypothetical protein
MGMGNTKVKTEKQRKEETRMFNITYRRSRYFKKKKHSTKSFYFCFFFFFFLDYFGPEKRQREKRQREKETKVTKPTLYTFTVSNPKAMPLSPSIRAIVLTFKDNNYDNNYDKISLTCVMVDIKRGGD